LHGRDPLVPSVRLPGYVHQLRTGAEFQSALPAQDDVAARSRFPTPQALISLAGAAPSTRQSGKVTVVSFRYAVDKQLRGAVMDFAGDSHHANPWAAHLYWRACHRGKSHSHATRILARAWLHVLLRLTPFGGHPDRQVSAWQGRMPSWVPRGRLTPRSTGREAAHLVIDTGRTIAMVAREIGVGGQLLGRWVAIERSRLDDPMEAVDADERAELVRCGVRWPSCGWAVSS